MKIEDYTLFEIPLRVTDRNNLPGVELRKVSTDKEFIELLVRAAYYGKPIMVLPSFKDRLRSVSSLVEKGILYKGKDGQFYFNDY